MRITVPDLIALFFSGFGILLCVAVGIQLLTREEGKRQTNVLLGSLLVLYALTLTNGLLAMGGIYSQYQYLYFIPIVFSLSVGPLFYLFVKSRIQPTFNIQRKDLIHFVLPAIQFLFYCAIGFRSAEYKSLIWRTVIAPYLQYVETGLLMVSTLGYLWAAWRLLRHSLPEDMWKQPVILWLRRYARTLLILLCFDFVYEAADWILWNGFQYNLFNTEWLDFPLKMAYASISFWIGYNAFLFQNQALITPSSAPISQEKAWEAQIQVLFEERQVHKDPELNLEMFAKMLNVPKNEVSRFFSQQGTTFRGKVNEQRVRTFLQLVEEGRHQQLTLLGMAYESGFNSKASFNRVFKQKMGRTPSDFLQSRQNKGSKSK